MRSTGFYVVVSRTHAEELFPFLSDEQLAHIDRQTAEFGPLLLSMVRGGVASTDVLNNGLELARRLKG